MNIPELFDGIDDDDEAECCGSAMEVMPDGMAVCHECGRSVRSRYAPPPGGPRCFHGTPKGIFCPECRCKHGVLKEDFCEDCDDDKKGRKWRG